MPSDKPRIATYTTKENISKFRIIAATKGKSMSEYLSCLIEKSIIEYENENGKLKIPDTNQKQWINYVKYAQQYKLFPNKLKGLKI